MANVISDETIEYVGILAKLELSDEEKEAAKKDMASMLAISFLAASFSSSESSSLARIPTYSIVSSLITLAMCASPFVVVIYAWRNWINHHKTRFRYLSLATVLSEIGHLRLKS